MLDLHGVSAAYGKAEVVHGVDLHVGPGEVVSLLGPNGAGKTTLLKAIAGTVTARGSIRLDGQEMCGQPAHFRPRFGVGHCPEGRRLFAELSVLNNLRLGAFSRRDAAGVEEDLERVFGLFPRLRERAGQRVSTLSGGEQQMAAVGRAMMSRPKLLVLDEPSVGIAQRLKNLLFQAVREICRQGVSILLVEQDVRAALAVSDRVYLMESGRIAREGTREALSADDGIRRAYFGM
ncbi:branched-chain amino acid transport system ATP-binding protein [Roseomonas rosea]|uniref:Branched-chain amino acid transport system ATP-binding protein n=1 Tax=Muricoccus roseus TaxID=198092 RepID=A0A1M6PTU3_9PROT|nr:ABC transporter ATP-binding protein [Roseomonas rosea]SHK11335.1 branched-chain amino acid transport system ATP-binding protein [Roseomonas rosea]